MNSTKNSVVNMDEDLKFVPLNIQEPFKSKDSSWVPFINIDADSDNITNNFFIGLPNLQTNQGFTPLPNINNNPILPYPSIVTTPSIKDLTNEEANKDVKDQAPDKKSNEKNIKNILTEDELYPSEMLNNELYSYNEENSNTNTTTNRTITSLTHLDILRDFDLSTDFDIENNSRTCCAKQVDNIFKEIEEDYVGLLSTLKTYKIPYPITSLIVKKIIKITLDSKNKV